MKREYGLSRADSYHVRTVSQNQVVPILMQKSSKRPGCIRAFPASQSCQVRSVEYINAAAADCESPAFNLAWRISDFSGLVIDRFLDSRFAYPAIRPVINPVDGDKTSGRVRAFSDNPFRHFFAAKFDENNSRCRVFSGGFKSKSNVDHYFSNLRHQGDLNVSDVEKSVVSNRAEVFGRVIDDVQFDTVSSQPFCAFGGSFVRDLGGKFDGLFSLGRFDQKSRHGGEVFGGHFSADLDRGFLGGIFHDFLRVFTALFVCFLDLYSTRIPRNFNNYFASNENIFLRSA